MSTATNLNPEGCAAFFDGRFHRGEGRRLCVVNPSDESVVAQISGASTGQVEAAIASARSAFDGGRWSGASRSERVRSLRAMLQWLGDHKERLTDLLVAEAGLVRRSPIKMAQVDIALKQADHILDLALTLPEIEDNPLPPAERFADAGSVHSFRRYEPVGVVSAISAYNFPFFISAWKVFPALVMGNALVLRPSPLTPLAVMMLAEAAAAADLPSGVLNVVIEDGAEGAVAMTTDPRVDMVTFTGSSAVGRQVMVQAAETMKRLQLELGGKSAQIYLPDSVELATAAGDRVCLAHSGQGCVLGTRIFVPEDRKAAVLDTMASSLSRIVVGPADDPATTMGPLISRAQVERCEEFVEAAVRAGGRIVFGGRRPPHLTQGFYFEPTVLDVADNDNPAAREEIFGPVVCVIGYRDVDHAVQMANDSPYGLSGHVFGKNMRQAYEVAARLRTGTVNINGGAMSAFASSGGRGLSGVGRERGVEGLRIYQEIKCMSVSR